MTSEDIPLVGSNYKLRRTRVTLTTTTPVQICKPNPSRWSLRIVNGTQGTIFVSPFGQDADFSGIQVVINDEWHTWFSREPVLCGMAWFVWAGAFVPPTNIVECWETTPSGT